MTNVNGSALTLSSFDGATQTVALTGNTHYEKAGQCAALSDVTSGTVVMAEGRKREVRRMLAAVGCPVRRLVRVRVGPVKLGALRPGALRPLTAEELAELYRSTGLRRAAPSEGRTAPSSRGHR